MINAVCFNIHVFKPGVLQRIVRRPGGRMTGYLVNASQVNCIQSFGDGSLFYSFCWKDEIDRNGWMDTGGDIERFIEVNRNFGRAIKKVMQ